MKIRRPYAAAKVISDRIISILAPHCEPEMCLVAGSVRRMAPQCGDVEIVCLPKTFPAGAVNLFGEPEQMQRSEEFVQALTKLLPIEVGNPKTGRYCKGQLNIINPKFIKGLCQVDIFMPQAHDFWRQLVIRTGSADFSRKIAFRWVDRGWVGTTDGLRRAEECVKKNDAWVLNPGITPTIPPAWESELEFFEWMGISWIEPQLR